MKAKLIKSTNTSMGLNKGELYSLLGWVMDSDNVLHAVLLFGNKPISVKAYLVEVYS